MKETSKFLQTLNIIRPELMLDVGRVKENIAAMAQKAARAGIAFRPHFKTHQSWEVGEWFREFGVTGITVSSVKMAEYFAEHNWDHITIGLLVNPLEINKINRLAERVELELLVDSLYTIRFLQSHLESNVKIWIKIDIGYGRTGIDWHQADLAGEIIRICFDSEKTKVKGLLTHNGMTYSAMNASEILSLHKTGMDRLEKVQGYLRTIGYEDLCLSIGDTPACSVLENCYGINEIRPGNFIFYDLMQYFIGSCLWNHIAMGVACPIIGVYPSRGELVVHGGSIHLSKEAVRDKDDRRILGYPIMIREGRFTELMESMPVISLSQEHGILKAPKWILASLVPGDILLIAPVHACLSANLFAEYVQLDGRRLSKLH